METPPNTTEFLIVGAGPAGSTLAYLLARAGRDVLLIDRYDFPRDKICGDGLTPRALAAMARIGLDPSPLSSLDYRSAVLVAPSGNRVDLAFGDYLGADMKRGLAIPRVVLDEWLISHARQAGAKFLRATADALTVEGDRVAGAELVLVDGRRERVGAALTVIATGAKATLLKQLGVVDKLPDPIIAVRTYFENVSPSKPAFEFYFERTLLPGYGWIFPLPGGRANVGIGIFSDRARLQRKSINRFFDEFLETPVMRERLAGSSECGPRRSHPLRADFPAHEMVGEGWIVAGECAGLVNPVTGEGIDLAMESAELAAAVLLRREPQAAWGKSALKPYSAALDRNFKGVFRGLRYLQRRGMTERSFEGIVNRSLKSDAFAQTALRLNLGLATPWAVLKPRVFWAIMAPRIARWYAAVFSSGRS